MKELSLTYHSPPLLAYNHISKAGGTTLNHILRRNYFMKCVDVRPLSKKSNGVFTSKDLTWMRRINPFVECIVGHSVRPYSDLDVKTPGVRYITVMREPVGRCISRYQHRCRKFGVIEFSEFLKSDWLRNAQTKFVCGTENIDLAKEIISTKYFAIGILEQFDEFLMILKKKLEPKLFTPYYRIQRQSHGEEEKQEILDKYYDQIVEVHDMDIELYNFVRDVIYEKEKALYGLDLQRHVAQFKEENTTACKRKITEYLDYCVRHCYYEPVTSVIRVLNGLPAKGVY